MQDIDVRHVPVDKLARDSSEPALQQREQRLRVLLEESEAQVVTCRDALERAMRDHAFLQREHEGAELAILLKRGDKVRVVCPQCKGSGMKPTDVTSGRLSRGSAFESTRSVAQVKVPDEVPEKDRCKECEGQRWVIMDRFRG